MEFGSELGPGSCLALSNEGSVAIGAFAGRILFLLDFGCELDFL